MLRPILERLFVLLVENALDQDAHLCFAVILSISIDELESVFISFAQLHLALERRLINRDGFEPNLALVISSRSLTRFDLRATDFNQPMLACRRFGFLSFWLFGFALLCLLFRLVDRRFAVSLRIARC